MVKYRHNQPYYELHLSQLAEDAVRVLSFQGEESISRLFRYRIELLSEDPDLDPAEILNQPATFVMNRGDEDPISVHGVISLFELRGRTPNYVHYYAELVPRMWRLTLTKNSEVFQKQDVTEMVSEILENSGFAGDDYSFSNLKETYPKLEYVAQYNETNFDFINRKLEHFGIFYYFDHSGDKDVIVFADSNKTLPKIEQQQDLVFNPNRDPLSEIESIFDIVGRSKVVSGLVRLKDYNHMAPNIDLTVESQLAPDDPGVVYEYGDHYKDSKQGRFIAKVRNEEILTRKETFEGRSDCRLFHAGYLFKMGQHFVDRWNDNEFLLVKVLTEGSQRGLFNFLPDTGKVGTTYINQFEAIFADTSYRPPRITSIPRLPGIMTSKLESGAGDQYAYIDDEGKYRMKVPFDLSDVGDGQASRPVRLSQPYSGPGYGVHFPNHAGTEIIWSCVNGDLDRPLGLGMAPNPFNSSPSSRGNKAQSVQRTAGGNEFTMDDTASAENIMLIATKDYTITVAGAKTETIGANSSSTIGANQIIKVGGSRVLDVVATLTETVASSKTTSIGAFEVITVGAHRGLNVGGAYGVQVGTALVEMVGAVKTEVIGGPKMTTATLIKESCMVKNVDAGSSISMSAGAKIGVTSGSSTIIKAGGKLLAKAGGAGVIEASSLTLKAGGAEIVLKGGNITMKGNKISIKASGDITVKGSKISQN
jgi:type VI secretion system secreted protein VgrG